MCAVPIHGVGYATAGGDMAGLASDGTQVLIRMGLVWPPAGACFALIFSVTAIFHVMAIFLQVVVALDAG